MDGIDLALIETDGETGVKCGTNMSYAYDPLFRAQLVDALKDARQMTSSSERPGNLGAVERELTRRHARCVDQFLKTKHLIKSDINLIGFHGQTVLHQPEKRMTVHLGLGELLACYTGIPTA